MKTPVVALVNKQNSYQLKILVNFIEIVKIIIVEMKDLKK